jgi:chemotaxis protein histidine kinase CheA
MCCVGCCSVSHESGWLPANINKWCLGAQRGTNTPFAVSRLCEAMQLQSAMSDVAQLRQIHMQQQLTPEEGQSFSESGDSAAVSRQCMKNIARAVNAAFSPSVAGADTPSEAVSTPMELINLVIWQSQKQPEGLPAAQQCLQLLQSQLGKGVDRSTLLQWLSDVRTFSLDDTTGELRQDPNSQWVTSLIKEEIVLPSTSEGTGQRKCSHPPALLIGPPLASGDEAHLQQGHSGQVEYHLLQMVHEHEDSPLHSRYSSSLSNLALSPMVPFISENAGTDGACRLYFLPVLGIQQVEPAIPLPITSTLSGDWDCHSGSLLELGLRVQLRCGDAVQLSPRLCSQLGSSCCGPRWDFESGQASAERDESQQLMTFFGALLMVGPGASDTTGTAEVWALLSDSLCRWWIYRVNLSSPLHKAPSLTGEAGQSQEPRIALHHLFGPSAKEGSAHQAGIDPQLSMTLWQGRCQEVWKAVLGWLHFAGDRVVPPPRRPPVMPPERSESLRPLLPKKAVNKPASAQRGGLHATQKAQRAAAKEGASNDSAPVVRPQMEEQKDGEEVHFTDIPEGPRRSSRHAHPPGDAVHELATDKRSGGEEEEMEDGTRKEDKEAAKKAKDKAAKQKAKLAAQKQKERDTEREQEEKERERKKETKNGKKERREPSKKQKKKAQRTPKSKKRERSKKREKPVDSAKKPNKRPRISQDSEVRAQPAEVAKGVLTRMRASAESTSAVSKQPAVVAKKRGGKGRGKKRKGTAHEEEKDIVTVEEWEDSEENIVESTNASTERAPPTSAQPSSQTSHPASSPSATSGSSSTPQPHSPAASGDEVGTTAVKSHDNQAKGAQISREGQAPSLWCVYMSGEEGLALPHKDKVNRWFEHGLHKVPMFSASDPHRRDDLSGPNVDVFEEWDFVLQTRIRKRHPENVVPLQRSRRPPNACLAQCFVASVGFYDKDVQNGYHDAVTAHRKLTDAYASKQNRTAVHIDLLANPPWEKFKGITLTTMTGDRMNECGTLIDNDTPSWPLNQYPSLDTFRAGLARIHRAQQERKEEHLPSPTPQKKIKTAKESASVMEWGDRHHRHAYGGGPSHTIRTKTEQKMDHQQAAYYEALRAQARASVAVSSSMGPSNLSVVSDTDSRSPSPFHQPLRSTNGPGRVGIFNAPVQFVASPQADGVIDLERTSSSARRKGTEGAPQFVFFTPVAAPHSAQPGGYSNYMNPSYFPPHPQPPTPPMQPGPYQVSYVPVQQSLPPQPTYAVGHPAPHVSHSLPYHPYQHQMAVAQLPSGFLIP